MYRSFIIKIELWNSADAVITFYCVMYDTKS
jgi:hypothetical protein